jgi:response regulator RpfG family c-di-GMP phosphodiesterase
MPEDEALAIIDEQKGRYFDPRVYDSFKRTLPKLRRIRDEVREEEEASPYLSGSFPARVS